MGWRGSMAHGHMITSLPSHMHLQVIAGADHGPLYGIHRRAMGDPR